MALQTPTMSLQSALSLLRTLADEGLELMESDPISADDCEIWHNQVLGVLLRALGDTHDVLVFSDLLAQYPPHDHNEKRESLAILVRLRVLRNALNYLAHDINLLRELAKPEGSSDEQAVAIVERICMTFPAVVRQLGQRHGGRSTFVVNDEYDVQDLLHAILRIYFDDIRREEWTPSYAGAASRVDFLLKNEKIVLEVKMTRTSLRDRQVGEQLIVDNTRYAAHPDCQVLVCFVYDPGRLVLNPEGVRRDLERLSSEERQIRVIISPT